METEQTQADKWIVPWIAVGNYKESCGGNFLTFWFTKNDLECFELGFYDDLMKIRLVR